MMQIELGALAPSLIEQLAGEVDAAILAHLDRDADAITRLYVRGYIAQSVADRARRGWSRRFQRKQGPLLTGFSTPRLIARGKDEQ